MLLFSLLRALNDSCDES